MMRIAPNVSALTRIIIAGLHVRITVTSNRLAESRRASRRLPVRREKLAVAIGTDRTIDHLAGVRWLELDGTCRSVCRLGGDPDRPLPSAIS